MIEVSLRDIEFEFHIVLFEDARLMRDIRQITKLGKKATIHQVTTMLATCKNVIFQSHNHLVTIGTDDLTLWISLEHQQGW